MDLFGPFEVEGGSVTGGVAAVDRALDGASRSDTECGSAGAPSGTGATAIAGGDGERLVTLVFYPAQGTRPELGDVLAALPVGLVVPADVVVEIREVPRDWVEGWRDHFRPVEVGSVRIRPPWEPPVAGGAPHVEEGGPAADVVINPGLGFGTGLHPTTRGVLQLLQLEKPQGPVIDVGTGSGILAIAAAKLGWRPVEAFDNDPLALLSAHENVEDNGVQGIVRIHETDLAAAPVGWFAGATVLANMTLEPVVALMCRLSGGESASSVTKAASVGSPGGVEDVADRAVVAGADAGDEAVAPEPPRRLVVSGILAGNQECRLLGVARDRGFIPGRRLYEAEWVSLEFLPATSKCRRVGRPSVQASGR